MEMILFVLSLVAVDHQSGVDSLVECYAEQTTALRKSTDPVETVVDVVMTLCEPMEFRANDELYEASFRQVQEHTGGSLAEAVRAASSVRQEGWNQWRKKMRGHIRAALVQSRLTQAQVQK